MQIVTPHITPSTGKKPPPLWFVTNGEVTVGPVTTNLLLRGVAQDRVPRDCLVRERTWKAFRKLERIREVAALRRAQSQYGSVLVEPARWKDPSTNSGQLLFRGLERELLRAADPGEVLARCLTETMRVTGACVGAVHRRRPPQSGLVTTCVSGPGMSSKLGELVALDDPSLLLALRGDTLCEVPRPALASGRVRDRLGAFPACDGIAMVPVLCGGRLYAMIELGRPDHAFRDSDFQGLRSIAELAADRLGVVRNGPASSALWGGNLLHTPH
jgi:hypothetical protein